MNQIDDVEQYGRRTSVRIHNVRCDSSDDCVDAVLDVLRNKMKVDVRAEDIDHCNPMTLNMLYTKPSPILKEIPRKSLLRKTLLSGTIKW